MPDDPKAAILKSLEQLHAKIDQLPEKIAAAVKEVIKEHDTEEKDGW